MDCIIHKSSSFVGNSRDAFDLWKDGFHDRAEGRTSNLLIFIDQIIQLPHDLLEGLVTLFSRLLDLKNISDFKNVRLNVVQSILGRYLGLGFLYFFGRFHRITV